MEQCTVRWSIVDNLMVSFASPGDISDIEFDAWMREFTAKPFTRYLNTSAGFPMLHSVQRKRAAEILKRKAVKTAVVSDETLLRGVATAISWMGADIKSFAWSQLPEALRHLDVTPATEQRAIEIAKRMRTLGMQSSSPSR